jgi:hypothetical protein
MKTMDVKFIYACVLLMLAFSAKASPQLDTCKADLNIGIILPQEMENAGKEDLAIICEDENFEVLSFHLVVESPGNSREADNAGAMFNVYTRTILARAVHGSVAKFTCIRVKSRKDGKSYFLQTRKFNL